MIAYSLATSRTRNSGRTSCKPILSSAAINNSAAISSVVLLMGSAPLRVDDAGGVTRNGSSPTQPEARP